MNLEIKELQNFYTKKKLGSFCKKNIGSLIKRNISNIVRENYNQENIIGYGYPIPYFDNLIKKNSEFLCLMPKNQGALLWPLKKNRSILVEQTEWPLESEISNFVIIAHGLENSDNPTKLLEESWRVLVPEGYLLIVVPNRSGFWARSDLTPFGFGRPYSVSQLSKLLIGNKFQILVTSATLLMPPTDNKFLLKMNDHIESSKRNIIIEIGPGKVLSGLIKRIDKTVIVDAINSEEDINNIKKNDKF